MKSINIEVNLFLLLSISKRLKGERPKLNAYKRKKQELTLDCCFVNKIAENLIILK
jgi:hypothetical protein